MIRFAVIISLVAAAAPAAAQAPSASPLRLTEVLQAARTTHPKLSEADAAVTQARGGRLSAARVFEPTADVSARSTVGGFYQYWLFNAVVRQQLDLSGVDVKAGYRLGRGDVPSYYGERETRSGGETFAEVSVPLLAGRSIDKARARLRKATLGVGRQQVVRVETWLRVARDASVAYWKWVAAGQKLGVSRRLVRIARERADRVNAQARSGALPRITVVDTERVVFERRTKLLAAEREFAAAAAKLSLYYRDSSRTPVVAGATRVPALPGSLPAVDSRRAARWIDDAVRQRPEMRALDLERRGARVDRQLARNDLLPKLDVIGSVARDLGTGSTTLGGTDMAIGFKFRLPLFRRGARGRRVQAQAKLQRISAKTRGARDRIAAEVRLFASVAKLARDRWTVSRARERATERLAVAERTRFDQGASDMIRVNLRELAAGAAANAIIDAGFEYRRALADLAYARGRTALDPN